jgi:hypothetical protein
MWVATLAVAAALTALVACGSDREVQGGTSVSLGDGARGDGTTTPAATGSIQESSEPDPAAEPGDEKLCALVADERLAEVFVGRSVPQLPVEDVRIEAVPAAEAPEPAAQLQGCAGRVSASFGGGATSDTVFVLGRSAYTGDASAPVAPFGGFPLTWAPLEGHAGMYQAGPLPFGVGGAVVVRDQVFVLLQAEVHSTGGEMVPLDPSEAAAAEKDQKATAAAARQEFERDLVVALELVAAEAG